MYTHMHQLGLGFEFLPELLRLGGAVQAGLELM